MLFTVCYQRHWPDQFRDMKNKTAFLPKPSNFQALWFSFVKDCRLPLPLLFQSAVESNKKRNLKPSPAETGEGIPVPGPMGRRGWASAVSTMLPLLPGWPQPGPLQFLPLLIGLEKGKWGSPWRPSPREALWLNEPLEKDSLFALANSPWSFGVGRAPQDSARFF